jgi:hypothetical protein
MYKGLSKYNNLVVQCLCCINFLYVLNAKGTVVKKTWWQDSENPE